MSPHLTVQLRRLKEAGWVLAGQILAFLGGVVGIKLLTNLMPPEGYGELALGITIAGIVNMFLFGPLAQVVVRYYSICREQGTLDAYSRILTGLHRKAIYLLIGVSVPVTVLIGIAFGIPWAVLVAVALIFSIPSGLQGSIQSLLGALRDRRAAAMTQGADSWLRLGLGAMFVALVAPNGFWALIGYIFGSLIVLLVQFKVIRRHNFGTSARTTPVELDAMRRAEMLGYALPFVAFATMSSIGQYADRWLLLGSGGANDVGIYAALYQIASAPVVFLMSVAMQLVIPVVFGRVGDLSSQLRLQGGRGLLSRTLLMIGFVYLALTLITYFWAEQLVTLLTNSEYARQANVLWLLVLALSLYNLTQYMTVLGFSMNRPKAYFWPKLGHAITLLVTGMLLVRVYGIAGMVYALVISAIVHIIWVALVNSKMWLEQVPKEAVAK